MFMVEHFSALQGRALPISNLPTGILSTNEVSAFPGLLVFFNDYAVAKLTC